MTREVGRPSKYSDAMQAKADEYLRAYKALGHVVPSRAGLACYLGIARSTTYEWGRDHLSFSDTLEAIDALQECLSLNGGLKGDMNSTIVKLVLANHGYSDKIQNELTSPDGSMTPKAGIDLSKLSDAALKELMNARAED